MYVLHIHSDAEADLDQLKKDDLDAWADLTTLIEEISGDQNLLDLLSVRYEINDKFDVDWYNNLQAQCLNIWRLKVGDLDADWIDYRVLYAFDGQNRTYYVLAVIDRDFDYERDKETTERIKQAYSELGLPLLPRA